MSSLSQLTRPLPLETLWRHVREERHALARSLAGLEASQWEEPSLCAGWSVRDVAAHAISGPQIGARELVGMLGRSMRLGYQEMIFRDAKQRGLAPVTRILADYERYADSRAKVATTTPVESLVDVVVHHQDIVRPLGIEHRPPVEAAVAAADRCRLLAALLGSRGVVRSVRMEATDADWTRGRGPTLTGPAVELLLVCAGRFDAAQDLGGDGLEVLAAVRSGLRPARRTSR